MKTYRVKSIFGPTLQGEGSYSGSVVKFLRFTGCNKWSGLEKDRANSICHFCDTDFRDGEAMTAEMIVERLNDLGEVKTVIITGGEPLLQLDDKLAFALVSAGYKLHVETNGSRPLGHLRHLVFHVSMSPKQSVQETKLEACDDLKVLYPPIAEDIRPEDFDEYPAFRKYLQPVMSESYKHNLEATTKKLYELQTWSLSLQTHKIVGVE